MIILIFWQALWAASIPISKVLLAYSPPIFLAGIRMVLAGIILLGFQWLYSSTKFRWQKDHLLLYSQIIFFGIYAKYILRYWGLNAMPTAKLAFMLNITPFCVALFSYIAFAEILSWRQSIGLIIGFIGFFPILLIKSGANPTIGWVFISWAELAVLGEIFAHSYAVILMRKMVRDHGYSSSMTNGIRMFGGGMLALITALFFEQAQPVQHISSFILWLALLIVLSNIICHNWHLALLKKYSATFLSFTDFLSPIFVSFYGWLFLHEIITWHYYASAIIVFIGLYLFYYEELALPAKTSVAH